MAGLDLATSSASYGEGFPNVIGEAMSSGVPCVVTDVGGSASIVEDTGVVVPPNKPLLLARGWKTILELSRDERFQLGKNARNRVIGNYSIDAIVKAYIHLYQGIWNT